MKSRRALVSAILILLLPIAASAQYDRSKDFEEATKNNTSEDGAAPENTFLYTKPDEAATGGITGRITSPSDPIELILATPAAEPEKVYKGELDPATPGAFSFKGLPAGRYDLIVFFKGSFYEGLTLSRDGNSLNELDLEKINTTLQKSEPYFPEKFIHRLEGLTGRGSQARMVVTYSRAKGSLLFMTTYQGKSEREDHKCTIKLVMLQDVGPGWQITKTRNYNPVWVKPGTPLPKHHFSPALSKIRVADETKDIGNLIIQ
ncbi:MAG: hypothetical protein ACKOLA_02010 [Spartobacteria bacterium]